MNECILVVDDDREIVGAIAIVLEREGYTVRRAYDGLGAVEQALDPAVRLILIDVMMPKLDGLSALMRIREKRNLPVIVLSAKSEDTDKILGLSMGADDYVTKPFNILELKARIRALLRRAGAERSAAQPESQQLRCGNLVLDLASRSALRDGVPVTLTAKEFDLMELFLRNPNRVFSRTSLLDQVWGYEYQGDDRTVDVHIRRLREKLEEVPASPAYIMTKWGVGYYLKNEDAAR